MEGNGDIVGLLAIGWCDSDARAEQQTIQVTSGEAVSVPSDERLENRPGQTRSIADVVNLSRQRTSVIGKKAGVTTLTIVKSDGSATQMYRIEVGNDAVAATIPADDRDTNVTVHAIGDALVLDEK